MQLHNFIPQMAPCMIVCVESDEVGGNAYPESNFLGMQCPSLWPIVGSARTRDGTDCEFDSWQCRIHISCS